MQASLGEQGIGRNKKQRSGKDQARPDKCPMYIRKDRQRRGRKDPDGPRSPGSTSDIIDPAALGLLAAAYSYVLPYSFSDVLSLSTKWATCDLKSVLFFLRSPFPLCLSRSRPLSRSCLKELFTTPFSSNCCLIRAFPSGHSLAFALTLCLSTF